MAKSNSKFEHRTVLRNHTIKNTIRAAFAASITAISIASPVAGAAPAPPPATIPFQDSLRQAEVVPAKLTDGQREGLLLGNGDLYGIVWEKDGGLFVRITKNDIWDARVDTSKDGELPRVDIATHAVTGATGAPPSYELPYPQPRSATALRLGPVPENMRARLDLEKANVTIESAGQAHTTLRILHDRNVLLIEGPHPVTLEEIKANTLPAATLGTTDGISWLRMKMPGDIDYKGMEYAIALATKGELKAVSLVTSFDIDQGDVLQQAIDLARRTVAAEEAALVATHEQGWRQFWSRSGVRLADKELERWWYRMLYFAGTVCRPGTAPVGLMPPLATDTTPWHADFHHNYNTWQAYWPLPAANHPELADPWIAYNHSMIPRFRNLARVTYGIDGLHVPISSYLHEPDPAASKSRNQRQMSMNPWGLTIGLQGMTLQSMWQKYLCDQDTEYMRTKIYPFLKEVATFYVSFMEKCGKDERGRILLGPSYSPEHGPMGIFNCPFDITYVHYTFNALIQASAVLKQDHELAEKCRALKALLPGYPTANNAENQPVVVDWKGCAYKQVAVHNITVPASPVFPGDQVTWFSPAAEKELFQRTIKDTRHNGNNSHVMFNIAKARLSMLDGYTDAKSWFTSRELPNGLFVWVGHGHGTYMPEMIGIAGLINEFLLQSVDHKIRLFPCWPTDRDASFARLRAQGGFLVSAEFSQGKAISATIESQAGKPLHFLSPWRTIHVNGKKATIDNEGLVTMPTKPGQVFLFTEANDH